MKSEKWAGGGRGVTERQRWETEARKRGGRYSHVINVKWWQSVGGGGESGFTAHYQWSASCWGGGVGRGVEEEDDTGTL